MSKYDVIMPTVVRPTRPHIVTVSTSSDGSEVCIVFYHQLCVSRHTFIVSVVRWEGHLARIMCHRFFLGGGRKPGCSRSGFPRFLELRLQNFQNLESPGK